MFGFGGARNKVRGRWRVGKQAAEIESSILPDRLRPDRTTEMHEKHFPALGGSQYMRRADAGLHFSLVIKETYLLIDDRSGTHKRCFHLLSRQVAKKITRC